MRDTLKTILGYPPTTQLSGEEQDALWKFRFYLSNQKKVKISLSHDNSFHFSQQALTKFLKCVKWSTKEESEQAIELVQQWAPMDVEDALELLSRNFTHPTVRQYAVTRLQQAPDEDLLLYLLQLVQALKYEDPRCVAAAASQCPLDDELSLTSKIERAMR